MRCEAIVLLGVLLISLTFTQTVHCEKPPEESKSAAADNKANINDKGLSDKAVENAGKVVASPVIGDGTKPEDTKKDDTIAAADEIVNPPVHSPVNAEIPASIMSGFYAFVALGFLAVVYITYRSFRIRTSRAARRYGTRGNHSRQELQPLPGAMESDSDGDDQQTVVFDRQP